MPSAFAGTRDWGLRGGGVRKRAADKHSNQTFRCVFVSVRACVRVYVCLDGKRDALSR